MTGEKEVVKATLEPHAPRSAEALSVNEMKGHCSPDLYCP